MSRLLYWSALAAAAGLLVLVVVAPLVEGGEVGGSRWQRTLSAFARDVVLRRVTLASALGLVVTARVFFHACHPPGAAVSGSPMDPTG